MGSGKLNRRQLLRRAAVGGMGLSAASLLAACDSDDAASGGGGSSGESSGTAGGLFPDHPEYEFVFVNHVTTNPFFVPTQYGIEDAEALVGTTHQWTGSEEAVVSEMVDAMNTAISGGADGIAVAIVDPTAFNQPIQEALDQGIPVVSYNADGKGLGTTPRLAYIGQDLFGSGVEMGKRILEEVQEGPVALFIATPGQLNIQPRIDGAASELKKAGMEFEQITTGPELPEELSKIEAYYNGHKDVKGMFAVDAGSTQGVAQVMEKFGLQDQGVVGGGYDLLPKTLDLIDAGVLSFTIDQQPYLQGFYPVMQLFLHKISGGLSGPAETNTGLLFVTQDNVAGYLENKSRFEGDSEEQQVLEPAT
ncbi:MAG: sugar ABC transporter substrate-binding protein [Actinobacteria bacterium]|nr:sugar ABC transporter substrate-binding protein [Actinomycetota bacterium]